MKELKLWLPQLTIGIIVIRFLNLHLYYHHFGIQIQNYLEISEIIFSLTTFLSSGIAILLLSLTLLLFTKEKDRSRAAAIQMSYRKENVFYEYLSTHRSKYLRWLKWFFNTFKILFYIATILLFCFGWMATDFISEEALTADATDFDVFMVFLLIYASFYLMLLSFWYKNKTKTDKRDSLLFGFVIVVGLILFIAYRNKKSAELVMSGHPKFSIELTTNDKQYLTSDSIVYVGTTKGYYFLYNRKTEIATVIPAAVVKEVNYDRLRGGL